MAPPANRRPGYSRRAQYGTFFGYLAGVLGAVIAAVLLIVSIFNPDLFSGLRNGASQITEPAGGAAARTRATGRDVLSVIEGYALAGKRTAKLRAELEEAKVRLAESDAVAQENKRLRQILQLSKRQPSPVTVTRITSSTPASTRRFATIGAGRSDGVEKGMPVRSRLGLVGRVLEVGYSSARVLLITDTESIVPVRRASDAVAGFAQGAGNGTLRLRLLDLGINPLKVGDVLVTSGSGGLYRPGTAIGVVTRLTRDGAIARVLANPAATEFVIVEPVRAPEANRPLEEDQGTDASTASPRARTGGDQ